MANPIQLELDDSQIEDLRIVFPELQPMTAAKGVAEFAVSEMIALLAGRKRYMSLSHQYVEWLEQLNVKLVPQVEFDPARLMNQFKLPPGSAGYIARVLRDRQNVELMKRGWQNLLAAFKGVKEYEQQKPGNGLGAAGYSSITLTKREYRLLRILLDSWEAEQLKKTIAERKSINMPDISETRLDYIKIKYTMQDIERILGLLEKRVGEGG